MKKALPILALVFVQGCIAWSWQRDFGSCQEISPGVYSCVIKVPKSSAVVSLGADIYHHTEQYIPVKSLRVRIENEGSHEIQVQGISPFVLLKPGESYDFNVKVGPATKGVDGAYICAFNTAVRVKLEIFGENLDDATIKVIGLAGDGP